MTKVAIMQPYFFPYIGYFQLMHAVDVFVFYDDAQYMKGGWVNRNRVLADGGWAWITLPVASDSIVVPINGRRYLRTGKFVNKIKDRLQSSYSKAPNFSTAFPFVGDLLDNAKENVAEANAQSLSAVSQHLGIGCTFVNSSSIDVAPMLKGQAKVIAICESLGASTYVNAIGGTSLYDEEIFRGRDIELKFLRPELSEYDQGDSRTHIPWLSIVDVLMFNDLAETQSLLARSELIDGSMPSASH